MLQHRNLARVAPNVNVPRRNRDDSRLKDRIYRITDGFAGWTTPSRSADLQSAVSPNCIRQTVRKAGDDQHWRGVTQIKNLRYIRMQFCATRRMPDC